MTLELRTMRGGLVYWQEIEVAEEFEDPAEVAVLETQLLNAYLALRKLMEDKARLR